MLKIIHGADFHLDSPFTGLTPERAAQRREEQRELLDRLGQLARERQADLVLLSGDLLDSGRVFQETAEALVRTLAQIPCPVFLAPGNHDYWSDRSVYATLDWPDHVHIFHTAAPERVDLPQLNCAVWGSAFLAPHQTESPFAGLRVPRDGRVHLGCFHGDMNPQSHYGPVTREEVAASGLHYLALGHIHQGSGLQREGDTFWAYSGCPEGRNFGETGEKGVLYVEVEPGQATAQLLPTAHRRYEILSVDLTGADDPLSAIRSALPGAALRLVCHGRRNRGQRENQCQKHRQPPVCRMLFHKVLPSLDVLKIGGGQTARPRRGLVLISLVNSAHNHEFINSLEIFNGASIVPHFLQPQGVLIRPVRICCGVSQIACRREDKGRSQRRIPELLVDRAGGGIHRADGRRVVGQIRVCLGRNIQESHIVVPVVQGIVCLNNRL